MAVPFLSGGKSYGSVFAAGKRFQRGPDACAIVEIRRGDGPIFYFRLACIDPARAGHGFRLVALRVSHASQLCLAVSARRGPQPSSHALGAEQFIFVLRGGGADRNQLPAITERIASGVRMREDGDTRRAADGDYIIADAVQAHVGGAAQLAFEIIRNRAFIAARTGYGE